MYRSAGLSLMSLVSHLLVVPEAYSSGHLTCVYRVVLYTLTHTHGVLYVI